MSIPDRGLYITHEDPNAFLANAIVSDLTPRFGSEICGVNLTTLNAEVETS